AALRIEAASVAWVYRCIQFHAPRRPRERGAAEVSALQSHLAVASEVAHSTQNQALRALRLLYRIECPQMT
ncbi:MAG: integron integrase, partial [Chloroflexia bacterium]|nr:integron integrase [Chloroflexia bacterium]